MVYLAFFLYIILLKFPDILPLFTLFNSSFQISKLGSLISFPGIISFKFSDIQTYLISFSFSLLNSFAFKDIQTDFANIDSSIKITSFKFLQISIYANGFISFLSLYNFHQFSIYSNGIPYFPLLRLSNSSFKTTKHIYLDSFSKLFYSYSFLYSV